MKSPHLNKFTLDRVVSFLLVLTLHNTFSAAVSNPAELARGHGYAAEEHTAQTDDGHLLGVFRIYNASSARQAQGPQGQGLAKDPVLLVPGLACNAAIWVLLGPGNALAYLLADRGYDVWLADYRGGMFSRVHVNLTDRDAAFWDFSMDDIGRLDIPAVLRLVVGVTARPRVTYIGHSMGAGVLTIMASSSPHLVDHIARAYMFAPAAYMGNASRLAVSGSADAVSLLHGGFGLFASGEIPLNSPWMHIAVHSFCSVPLLCLLAGGLYAGHDSDQVNRTAIPFYVDYIPDSISVKNVRHFTQHFGKEHVFRRFDLGLVKNVALYGQEQPPEYDLGASTFPSSIYYGSNDFLVNPQDVAEFSRSLPNQVRPPYRIPLDRFNHIDFFLAMDAQKLLYDQVIHDLQEDEMQTR